MTSRRSFLLGLGAALAAPAIVRAEVLMPVRRLIVPDFTDATVTELFMRLEGSKALPYLPPSYQYVRMLETVEGSRIAILRFYKGLHEALKLELA